MSFDLRFKPTGLLSRVDASPKVDGVKGDIHNMKRFSTAVIGFVLGGGMMAHAGVIPYSDPAGQGTQDFGGNLALTFNVLSPITVVDLGVFNAAGNGIITGSISVAIYNTSTDTIVTPVVTFSG